MQIGAPQILKAIAFTIGGLAALAAAIELGRVVMSEGTEAAATEVEADPLHTTLARCRDPAPEDYANAADCRAAWEESRRYFFGLPPAPSDVPGADPAGTE
jgi:conjugative transfer region protein TrbK